MNKIIKNYRDNAKLRASFNKLAEESFGLYFEDWYQNGFWGDHYNPYSILVDGEVVANVSVNDTPVMWKGERKHFLQLGTVMTRAEHRNRGYIREIMEEIERDYAGKVDGIYLFGNDSVVDFYPKFGFQSAGEYEYFKETDCREPATVRQIPMDTSTAWKQLQEVIKSGVVQGGFEPVDNSELYMFYVTKFMQECVYYLEDKNAYVIAEQEKEELLLHAVFAKELLDLEDVIRAFGAPIKKVTLGFTPRDTAGWQCREHKEEDCTLFIKGEGLRDFPKEKLMFALLGHA